MSLHKLMAGNGYSYLTRHVAAGDAGLTGLGDDATARLRPAAAVTEAAMAAVFRGGRRMETISSQNRPAAQPC